MRLDGSLPMTGDFDLGLNDLIICQDAKFRRYSNTIVELSNIAESAMVHLRLNALYATQLIPVGTVFYIQNASSGNKNVIFKAYDSGGVLQECARLANYYGAYSGEFQISRAGDISVLDDKFLQVGKDSDGSLPAPSASYRGKMIRVEGAEGVADRLYMCMKKADDTYGWIEIGGG
jgi:hypothetical protein